MTMQLLINGALVRVCPRCRQRIPHHREGCSAGFARGDTTAPAAAPAPALAPVAPAPVAPALTPLDPNTYRTSWTRMDGRYLFTPMIRRELPWRWTITPCANSAQDVRTGKTSVFRLESHLHNPARPWTEKIGRILEGSYFGFEEEGDAQRWAEDFDRCAIAARRPGWRVSVLLDAFGTFQRPAAARTVGGKRDAKVRPTELSRWAVIDTEYSPGKLRGYATAEDAQEVVERLNIRARLRAAVRKYNEQHGTDFDIDWRFQGQAVIEGDADWRPQYHLMFGPLYAKTDAVIDAAIDAAFTQLTAPRR